MNYTMLINKENKLDESLKIKFVNTKSKYNKNIKLERRTAMAYNRLKNKALKDGYIIDIESGYRTFEEQKELFNQVLEEKGEEHTLKYVAQPGYSEHQTGLAVDICLIKNDKILLEWDLPEDFKKYLEDNAYKFGFVIRYKKGKEEITKYGYEPWHLRYVGSVNLAKKIEKNNITLEEIFD